MTMGNSIAHYVAYLLLFGGFCSNALPYDYTAITDCMADPLRAQYNGGIIVNPEGNNGLKGWTTFGDVRIELGLSDKGNKYVVAHSRKHSYDSMSQKVFLLKDHFYTFSAWIQVSAKRNVTVNAIFKTNEGYKYGGGVVANVGCWSMLKGGVSVDSSGFAQLYFESHDTSIDIWVDSVSLQAFTKEEWRAHQDQSIDKVRKSKVKIQILDNKGKPLSYTNITLQSNKIDFPFGVAINNNILTNNAYRDWFTKRFTVTTFENEMKWYSTERSRGKEDYSASDAMLRFCGLHGISVRGHNIFWDDPSYQPSWVYNLSRRDLKAVTERRMNSIVSRYAGKVIGWDVNNENLHFNYFESKLGLNITKHFFKRTKHFDRSTTLFINDYNIIEDNRDEKSLPSKVLQKIRENKGSLGRRPLIGIGVEGHFDRPNIPYMRSALDTLASAGLPIWITELDVRGPNQISRGNTKRSTCTPSNKRDSNLVSMVSTRLLQNVFN
ncbi:hypothetical protein RND81_11G136300 [Saponaria officinalis]|uniref:GH10 domain-containing protein n=1 Tax=Saponaria officinalis TaxID=3572 RepID=A0AAW1HKQ8_SAPOF